MIEARVLDDDYTAKMEQLIAGTVVAPRLMQALAGIMMDEVEENFAQEGRPEWMGLKPSTIKARAKAGHWPGKILQVSGQLAASISESSTADTAVVGTNKEYAAIHQLGGKAGRGKKVKIEPRPFLVITEQGEERILTRTQNYLRDLTR
jgi:phage virion morphogenesis protein